MTEQPNTNAELTVEQDIQPCKHMEGMINSYADDTLRGPARWYTQFHIMHCGQCRAAAKNLRSVIVKISDLRNNNGEDSAELTADRRSGIDRALDEVDSASPK